MDKVARLRKLSWPERQLLLEASLLLLAVDLLLRWRGFARARHFAEAGSRAAPSPRGQQSVQVDRVVWLVAVAARHHLYPMRCLVQSLTLQRLLRRRGVPAELRIGVQRDGESIGAHAWLEAGGRPINARQDVEETFLPLLGSSATEIDHEPHDTERVAE